MWTTFESWNQLNLGLLFAETGRCIAIPSTFKLVAFFCISRIGKWRLLSKMSLRTALRVTIAKTVTIWEQKKRYCESSERPCPGRLSTTGSQKMECSHLLNCLNMGHKECIPKPKAGVGGSAQACAIIRSATSSFSWKQKLVSSTIKTLAVIAFLSWGISEKGK